MNYTPFIRRQMTEHKYRRPVPDVCHACLWTALGLVFAMGFLFGKLL